MSISEAILNHRTSVELPKETTFDDVRRVIRVYMREHPEIFWFSHQYKYNEKTNILALKYNFTKGKACFYQGEISKVISEDFQVDKVIGMNMSDLERVTYVYLWLAHYCSYNEYSSFNQTIYSVLINRNSVCTGYAKTAQYFLSILGVESRLVFGKFHSDSTENGRHCWNLVKIDGEWYHVDFCLADQSLAHLLNKEDTPLLQNGILWNYFGVSTAKILTNRTIEFVETLPQCKNLIVEYPQVQLLIPAKSIICCKSESGTSAKVFLDAYDKHAVVKVPRNGDLSQMRYEADILEKLAHANHVIKSFGLRNEGLKLELLTPWSEMLNSHYYKPSESMLRDIIVQLTNGLIECREKGITYSDIHYNNVFVFKDGVYKWGDFGIVYQKRSDGSLPPQLIGEDGIALGSRWFMAPETFHKRVFSEASAIYSLAMMAYFVMNDMRPPFWEGETQKEKSLTQRLSGINIPNPLFCDRYGDLWKIIQECLSFDAEQRPQSFEYMITGLCDIEVLSIERQDPLSHVLDLECDDDTYLVETSNNGCIDDMATTSISPDSVNEICNISDSDSFATTLGGSWGDGKIRDSDSFACTAAFPGAYSCPPSSPSSETNQSLQRSQSVASFAPEKTNTNSQVRHTGKKTRSIFGVFGGLFSYLFCSTAGRSSESGYAKCQLDEINACVYAPAQIRPGRSFIIRVYIYKPEESEIVDSKVKSIDPSARKKEYKPLDLPVRAGDKLTVQLNMSDGVKLDSSNKTIIWRNHFADCSFMAQLADESASDVFGTVTVFVNDIPAGELLFTIDVVEAEERTLYAKVESHRYSKIFISYSHADEAQVRGFAECCRALGTDYFFDRHTLRAGDLFKNKILECINNADLFVLCWSKNAAESEWVQIERGHALSLIRDGKAHLAIYPLSLKPEAPLPLDMSDKYNFGML